MIAQMSYISTVSTTPRFTGIKRPHPDSLLPTWSPENGNDDCDMEIISLDEDEDMENEEEEKEDDNDSEDNSCPESFPPAIVYLEGEQRKNHRFIKITNVSPEEEDEEIDIEESADSDVEEIGVIENETIEILDDDDEEDDIPDKKQSSPEVLPVISNGETKADEKNEKHDISSDDSSKEQISLKSPISVEDTDDCIIVTPKVQHIPKISVKPIQDLLKPIQKPVEKNNSPQPQFQKSVLIGGVVKKVLTAQDLKSGVIPMKSILNKGVIRGGKAVKVMGNTVMDKRNQISLLKPLSIGGKEKREQHSLLKPVTTEPKSLLKPELVKERREPQSILKSVKNRGDILLNNQCLRKTVVKPKTFKPAISCSSCNAVFLNDKDLREHIQSEHPQIQLKESTTYSLPAILELVRELKDQSPHCRKCYAGLCYLPTLRTHALVHPTGHIGCDACEHGMGVIKKLILHLEAHVDIIDSD